MHIQPTLLKCSPCSSPPPLWTDHAQCLCYWPGCPLIAARVPDGEAPGLWSLHCLVTTGLHVELIFNCDCSWPLGIPMDRVSKESSLIFLLVSVVIWFPALYFPGLVPQLSWYYLRFFSELKWKDLGAEAINWGPSPIWNLCDLGYITWTLSSVFLSWTLMW